MGILETVNVVVSGVKKVCEVSRKIHDAELQDAVAQLMLSTADLKIEIADAREENLRLRGKIQDLEKKNEIRAKAIYKSGHYYLREPIEGYSEGPFCPLCLDEDGLLITTVHCPELTPQWICGRCEKP